MEPTAPAARPILDWMPPYLATLGSQGHARALHVARVDEGTVEAALADHPAFDKACRDLTASRERRMAQAKPLDPAQAGATVAGKTVTAVREHRERRVKSLTTGPVPASAAALLHFVGNNHATTATLRSEITALLHLAGRIGEFAGFTEIDGVGLVEWFNLQRRVELERLVLSMGDTDPALVEYLQRQFTTLREQAAPGSIAHPPED